MTKEMLMDLIRTGMKLVGGMILGSATAKAGGLTGAGWDSLTAALLVLSGFAWSLWSTYKLTK